MRAVPLLILGLLLVACGGGAPPDQQVRTAFATYNRALHARDYTTACKELAPETIEALKLGAKRAARGATPPKECDAVLSIVYGAFDASPTQKKTLDEITSTAKIDKLTIKGDTATIDWSSAVNGKRTPVVLHARPVDGHWLLVDTNQ
jgi:hypothetical protein